ncbi:MAG: phage major capsid protein [Oscillospiraceae bacterium]|nr:phage major capsid protein [Oscillospiraceae bacterium]
MTINELRENRAKVWEQAKSFLDSHRGENGILSAEDTAIYERMEQDIVDLGHEVERQQRADALEQEMNAPVSAPITAKPETPKVDQKAGRASDAYMTAFWNQMRNRTNYEIRNALSEGVDTEGGYLVPDTFERTLIQTLNDELVFRQLAHTFTTSSGVHKIPVVSAKGTASWVEENAAIPETTDTFGQLTIGAHKLAALIKVSEELLNDSAFDLESYFRMEFARRIADAEEEAFLIGDGDGKPYGILDDAEGADVGVTAASGTDIAADEIITLYYSLRAPYRKHSVWLMNDSTISAIRKLKDNNGQYMWQPSLREGAPDTLLGKPVYTSVSVPNIEAGSKVMAFGDLSYYWIGDRAGISFKRLNELYATTGQVGFLSTKRVDGRLILSEAVQLLQMSGTAAG